jgi:peptidoglycan/LPS O-acetylase OafA/YrhL
MATIVQGETDTATSSGIVSNARRFDSLQALRALAATTVIFDHIPFVRCGAFGVDVFFVLSGFVMCHISLSDPQKFFVKRIFRVVPLYWICTLGVALIAIVKPGLLVSTSFSGSALLKSLFFIPFQRPDHNVAPLLFLGWTLEFEMLFYAIFGTSLKITRKYAREVVIGSLILLMVIGKIARVTHHSNVMLNFYSKSVILEFAFGIVCYTVWARYGKMLRRIPGVVAVTAAALSYLFFILMDVRILSSYGPVLRFLPDFLLRGLPASIVLLAFLSVEEKFKFPALVLLIGDASYSLYLLHPYILESLNREFYSLDNLSVLTVLMTAVSIAVCYLCAVISFKLFEHPSNIFMRKFFLRKRPAAIPLRAVSSAG